MRHPKPSVGNRSQTTLKLREITMNQLASIRIFQSFYQPVPCWDALDAPPSEAARRADI
jgi:hypothetical protein